MKIYDTAKKSLVELDLKDEVHIYTCGITPYDAAHLGHIFTFLTYDLLQRRLEDKGHKVKLVRNVTDVDEPIYKKAKELGIDYRELAKRETEALQSVLETLNFRKPFAEPLASEYIVQMSEAVKTLLDKGYAYKLENDIYYDVSKFKEFGEFSGFSERLKLGFMTDRGGDPKRPGKRNPLDFLLWKGITDENDPAKWETVLGIGRPGWHIECSVMSSELLGTPIDIHGGGMDLIFPHHECEIAQSEALGANPFSHYWMHVAPLSYLGEKMSKSLGNLVFAKDLLIKHSPATIKLALFNYHYRTGGEWRNDYLLRAKEFEGKLKRALSGEAGDDPIPYIDRVRSALDHDLNTQEVLQIIHDLCDSILAGGEDKEAPEGLKTILDLLGIKI